MTESIRIHVQRIEEILNTRLLWNQDELVIENYLKLISLIGDTLEKYTVEEKIEGFRVTETEIAKLKSEIETSPTEFSYDYVYSKLDDLPVIMFYPGVYDKASLSLFNEFNENNYYRAFKMLD